jgi:hypothetical protein
MPLIAALVVPVSTLWFLPVLLLVLAVPVWRSLLATAAERQAWAYREGLVTAARADREHAAALAGDEVIGVYGDWPPAVIARLHNPGPSDKSRSRVG